MRVTKLFGQSGEAQGFGELRPNVFVLHLHPRPQTRNREMRFNFEQFPYSFASAIFLSQTCETCCKNSKRYGRTRVLCQCFFVPNYSFVVLTRYEMRHAYSRIDEPRSWITGAQPVGTAKVF